jgi:hypothetical protein
VYYEDVEGRIYEAHNPPMEAFAVLDEARKLEPTAVLRYYRIDDPEDDD